MTCQCVFPFSVPVRSYRFFFGLLKAVSGPGLGLFIVYGIVKNHGGFLTCPSQVDRGTEFNIYLPALPDKALERHLVRKERPTEQRGSERILIIDDDQAIVEVVREYLGHFGYRVESAASGEDALDALALGGQKYDLVLLDLGMPGMGGYRALEEIMAAYHTMKVLVASGYATEENRDKVLRAGAKGFLGKPYHLEKLLVRIRETLDQTA